MKEQPVYIIKGSTIHYDELTIDLIQEHRYNSRVGTKDPTHLFLTEKGVDDLSRLVSRLTYQGHTIFGMYVVVLPTLAENTLMMGVFNPLEIEEETIISSHNPLYSDLYKRTYRIGRD